MFLNSARSLVTTSLLNISTILLELGDNITDEERDSLTSAWDHLANVRKSMTARIGQDTTLDSYLNQNELGA